MKVPSLIGSNPATRAMVAVSLALAMTAAVAAPLMAAAQETPPAVAPPVTVKATAAAAVTTLTVVPSAPAKPAPPAKKAAVAKKLTVPQVIAKVGHDARLSTAQVAALLWIAKHESNYHPTSVSGSGCHGLFQLSSAMVNGHPWKDPTWNTKRAIKYMKGRYGGVTQAKAFWSSHHWY